MNHQLHEQLGFPMFSDNNNGWFSLYLGSCVDVLPTLPEGSVQCVVTSPPYYLLRDYGLSPQVWPPISYSPFPGAPPISFPADPHCDHQWSSGYSVQNRFGGVETLSAKQASQKGNVFKIALGETCVRCGAWKGNLGHEPSPEMYVAHMVYIFRLLRTVLKDDGTVWLNIGDSYAGSGKGRYADGISRNVGRLQESNIGSASGILPKTPDWSIGRKNLLGIPWRVAFALQADGWILRADIIWHKPNGFVESVKDRPTRNHEYVFLLTKSQRYYYDYEAVLEPYSSPLNRWEGDYLVPRRYNGRDQETGQAIYRYHNMRPNPAGRNRRSVWSINTRPSGFPHFATFPDELPKICILAGTRPGDIVLDPFCGIGTTGVVALQNSRHFIGIDMKDEYISFAEQRLSTLGKAHFSSG